MQNGLALPGLTNGATTAARGSADPFSDDDPFKNEDPFKHSKFYCCQLTPVDVLTDIVKQCAYIVVGPLLRYYGEWLCSASVHVHMALSAPVLKYVISQSHRAGQTSSYVSKA